MNLEVPGGQLALGDIAEECEELPARGAVIGNADFDVPFRTVLAAMHGLELVTATLDDAAHVFASGRGVFTRRQVEDGHAK